MSLGDLDLELERLIDQNSLAIVLERIQYICFEKSEHLDVNWQDKSAAKQWDQAGKAVGSCSVRKAVVEVS